ncbi:MAG: UDP-2,4-diacetamido-2,4,6-trideoxy-beta-L-altropyranose hydrolase [Marinobacter sp.]|nr:UDP-2,4-diacetamido-2,4,6-trideoxy-beta-L-altropyranose hydrolase [Marinobacter sp.]
MKVVFRADASLQIGTGHVMRCLTLAQGLAARGHECHFVTRLHPGNLNEYISQCGFAVQSLESPEKPVQQGAQGDYASWLGVSQSEDAAASAPVIEAVQPDWVIVDHYALGADWETAIKSPKRIMVIDDLANRNHRCDLLLDQTYERQNVDYRALIPSQAKMLCGAEYALLREEFSELRAYSLDRKKSGNLDHLLVTMGGVDKDNATEQVLNALKNSQLPEQCRLTVVMGNNAPWLRSVQAAASALPWPTEVRVGVRDMAALMANCDAAIGAAGATSWERCCLGLPTIMVVLADNQRLVAKGLAEAGAALVIDNINIVSLKLPEAIQRLASSDSDRWKMCSRAASIVDGLGAHRVIDQMEQGSHE